MSAEVTTRDAVEAAVCAERDRLALDLHDTAGQAFSVLALLLRHELEGLAEGSPQHGRLLRLAELADQGKRDLQLAIDALAFLPAVDTDLRSAVTALIDRFGKDCGLQVSLDVDGDTDAVPARVTTALCRVAAEALVNVWRHARAGSVAVELRVRDSQVLLRVGDDGAGLNGNGSGAQGTGTTSMRRAVEALGGRLRIKATGSGGTLVEARVPTGTG